MSNPIIQVEGIGKSYKISHELKASVGNVSIRDGINNIVRKPIELVTGHRMRQEKFWALKDINFDVNQGEVVGIIGKNGSGKSTLLKILSRITEPTKGEIRMHGRVASLLEVGTGFHPELTGRENIFFNGSILGMRKKEIESKFDEIVAFSEVEQFLDTPVKYYSSGMYVRLAFAVAAHLEPDILIVDEVLAVGDTAFQKKCLGKMQDVAGEGRTVLFVTHNMPTMQLICNRAIVLEKGIVKYDGDTHKALDKYLNFGIKKNSSMKFSGLLPGDDIVKLLGCSIQKKSGEVSSSFEVNEPITVQFDIKVLNSLTPFTPNIHLKNAEGEIIFVSSDQTSVLGKDQKHPEGVYSKFCTIPGNLLSCDTYYVGISVSTMQPVVGHFYEEDIMTFSIAEDASKSEKTSRGNYTGTIPGLIRPVLKWESTKKEDTQI